MRDECALEVQFLNQQLQDKQLLLTLKDVQLQQHKQQILAMKSQHETELKNTAEQIQQQLEIYWTKKATELENRLQAEKEEELAALRTQIFQSNLLSLQKMGGLIK